LQWYALFFFIVEVCLLELLPECDRAKVFRPIVVIVVVVAI
jgi:hypothetical protein